MKTGKREWKGVEVWASDGAVAPRTSRRKRLAGTCAVVALSCCMSALGSRWLNFTNWGSSTSDVKLVLAQPHHSAPQQIGAVVILNRDIRESLGILQRAAIEGRPDVAAQARLALDDIANVVRR